MNKSTNKLLESRLFQYFALSAALHTTIGTIIESSAEKALTIVQESHDVDLVGISVPSIPRNSSTGLQLSSAQEVRSSLPVNKVSEEAVHVSEFVGPQPTQPARELTEEELQLKSHSEVVKSFYREHFSNTLWDKYNDKVGSSREGTRWLFNVLLDYMTYWHLSEMAVRQGNNLATVINSYDSVRSRLNRAIVDLQRDLDSTFRIQDMVVNLNRLLLSTNYSASHANLGSFLLGEAESINCEARAVLTSLVASRLYSNSVNIGWEFVIQSNGVPHVRTVVSSRRSNYAYPIDGAFVQGRQNDYESMLDESTILKLLTGRYQSDTAGFGSNVVNVTSSIMDSVPYTKQIEAQTISGNRVTKSEESPLNEAQSRESVSGRRRGNTRSNSFRIIDVNDFFRVQIQIAKATGSMQIDLNDFSGVSFTGVLKINDFNDFQGVKVFSSRRSKPYIIQPNSLEGLDESVAGGSDFSLVTLDLTNFSYNGMDYDYEDVSVFKKVKVSHQTYEQLIEAGADVSNFDVSLESFTSVEQSIAFSDLLNRHSIENISLTGTSDVDLNFSSYNGLVSTNLIGNSNIQFKRVVILPLRALAFVAHIARSEENVANFETLVIKVYENRYLNTFSLAHHLRVLRRYVSAYDSVNILYERYEDDSFNQQIRDAGFSLVDNI